MFTADNYKLILDHLSDGVYVLDPQRRITYWNSGAEKLSGFKAEEVVGKSCRDNILTHVDECGKCLCKDICPASHTLVDGKPREGDVYLHHKDGYRVPVHASFSPIRDDKGQVIAVVEVFRDDSARRGARAAMETLKKWAMNDLSSGLPNRRFMQHAFQSRLDEYHRFGWPFGVFLAEIDHYQEILAGRGREFTDRVLRMAGGSIVNALRSFDAVGRWEDNAFLAVVANAGTDQLQGVAERARMLVEASYLNLPDGIFRATVSVGAAAAERADTLETLTRRAGLCLYHSRTSGRNRVTISDDA